MLGASNELPQPVVRHVPVTLVVRLEQNSLSNEALLWMINGDIFRPFERAIGIPPGSLTLEKRDG